jgi:phosphoglycerate dehydrogenase-like enzyme
VGFDPYLPRGQEIALGVRRAESLDELLRASDAVSLHCPLTPETHRMIDEATFAAMRSHAVLINTARGGIVDLGALYRALETGQITGAALDVLPAEPSSPDEPLMRAFREQREWLRGRLLLTPHAAWNSPESRRDSRRLSTETTGLFLREKRSATASMQNCWDRRACELAKGGHKRNRIEPLYKL